jgi:hypothetical protein
VIHSREERWDRLVDRWVRDQSRRLDDAALLPRKLLHTSLIAAVWPILHLERSPLALILLGSCLIVIVSQRRVPYASLALLTLLAFAPSLAIAGAWAVFTAGDGLSAIAGRVIRGPSLPWNRRKTWSGSLTFLVAATTATLLLLRVDRASVGWVGAWVIAAAASLGGAAVESLDLPLDDNYSVIVVAGVVLRVLLAV